MQDRSIQLNFIKIIELQIREASKILNKKIQFIGPKERGFNLQIFNKEIKNGCFYRLMTDRAKQLDGLLQEMLDEQLILFVQKQNSSLSDFKKIEETPWVDEYLEEDERDHFLREIPIIQLCMLMAYPKIFDNDETIISFSNTQDIYKFCENCLVAKNTYAKKICESTKNSLDPTKDLRSSNVSEENLEASRSEEESTCSL